MLAVTGCATNAKEIFGGSPIAMVSLLSNNDINWKDEAPVNTGFASRSQRRAIQGDPDQNVVTYADTFIDEIEETIRGTLEMSPHISFAPRASVLSARSYGAARINPVLEAEGMAKPEGYRYVNYRDKNFLTDFASETGSDKIMFITLDLTKIMAAGFGKNGNCRASITMSVILKDGRGKTLFNKDYYANSNAVTDVSNGVYSQAELRQLVSSAIVDACYNLMDDILY